MKNFQRLAWEWIGKVVTLNVKMVVEALSRPYSPRTGTAPTLVT